MDNFRRKAQSGFIDAISQSHNTIPKLTTICVSILQDLLKESIDNLPLLANCEIGVTDMILSNCTPVELKKVEARHEAEDMELNTENLWESFCSKKWTKAGCKNKPARQSWRDFYYSRSADERKNVETAKMRLLDMKEKEANVKKKELRSIDIFNEPGTRKVTVSKVVSSAEAKKNAGKPVVRSITSVVKTKARKRTPVATPESGEKKSSLWAKAERDLATNRMSGPAMSEKPVGIMRKANKQNSDHMVSESLEPLGPKIIKRPVIISAPKRMDLARSLRQGSPDRDDAAAPSPVTPLDTDRIFGRSHYSNASSRRYGDLKKQTEGVRAKRPRVPTKQQEEQPSKRVRMDPPSASRSTPTTTTSKPPSIRSSDFGGIKIPKKK